MTSVKKFITYELLNDFILLQDIADKSKSDGKSPKNIIKTIEVDDVPFSVDIYLKSSKKGIISMSSLYSFVLQLSEDTNFSKQGKLLVKVTYPSGKSVPLSQISLSCYTFSIPARNKNDRIYISVTFRKHPEPMVRSDFDYLREFITNANCTEADNENQSNFSLSNSSPHPPAPKRLNLDVSGVSSSMNMSLSCGESFYGEVATNKQCPIGTGKPDSSSGSDKTLENDEKQPRNEVAAALDKIRKLTRTTIYEPYKKQLSCQHVLTTKETVELLKVSMGRNADISANLIIVAAKFRYHTFAPMVIESLVRSVDQRNFLLLWKISKHLKFQRLKEAVIQFASQNFHKLQPVLPTDLKVFMD